MTKIVVISIVILLNLINFLKAETNKIQILYKIENEIITNYDLNDEIKYIILGRNLGNLDIQQLKKISETTLIREKIKLLEINKYFNIDFDLILKSEETNKMFQNLSKNLNFETLENFKEHLSKEGINENELKKKLIIEKFWNRLIVDLYGKKVKINESKIEIKIQNLKDQNLQIKNFNLSEIVYSESNVEQNKLKLEEIKKSIETVGFEKTASIFSISESAKMSGNIGWVNENQISEKILREIIKLEIGQYSNPIITAGGNIILKLNNIEEIKKNFDEREEKNKIINFERNRILNEYSLIHYKKLENQTYVEKL